MNDDARVSPDDPFDDPEVQAFLAREGIVRTPGMAAKLMRDLGPLVADEGFDLENLGEADVDGLNAALARATERHNLTLFTPIGDRRQQALAVLVRVARAVADDDEVAARRELGRISPEATVDLPAISDVMGVSIGLLDRWYSDPVTVTGLSAARFPRWAASARKAGTDIVGLARKGRGFDSLDRLHFAHSGLALYEAGALAVAAALTAWSRRENLAVEVVARRELDLDAETTLEAPMLVAAATEARGAAFGIGSTRPERGSDTSEAFTRWLATQPDGHDRIEVGEVELLQDLLALAVRVDLDLSDPDDVDPFIETLFGISDPDDPEQEQTLGNALEVLHDYVHFRLERSAEGSAAWKAAHAAVESAIDELDELDEDAPMPPHVAAALEASAHVGDVAQRTALSALPVVRSVSPFLDWIGAGRALTSSGMLRRVDIPDAAAFLGIDALGVRSRAAADDLRGPSGRRYVLSLREVPEFMAWWNALHAADILESSATRVRPGPAAMSWRGETPPSLALAEQITTMCSAFLITGGAERTFLDELAGRIVVARLFSTVAEDSDPIDVDVDVEGEEQFLAPRVARVLEQLALTGLITVKDGAIDVAPGLEPAVTTSALVAITLLIRDVG
ncbi:hypothetical protein [Microbacterium aurantiacum]|uniref:Uncharacterized protein n=1 Tax=Microbacterium aurantiacum TaxID=162393 RepID=A0A0M9VM51_9MICO|nr:hypothetical protein [Microbacterium chocolatum]KOS11902.1 hypothetical protein XI38_00160 [Microbacterium chocolatum]